MKPKIEREIIKEQLRISARKRCLDKIKKGSDKKLTISKGNYGR